MKKQKFKPGIHNMSDIFEYDLTNIDLSNVNLSCRNLTGMDLSGTNLTNCNFTGSILQKTRLKGAYIILGDRKIVFDK